MAKCLCYRISKSQCNKEEDISGSQAVSKLESESLIVQEMKKMEDNGRRRKKIQEKELMKD